MTFVKGYVQSPEHKAAARRARHKKNGLAECPACGKRFKKYNINAVTCGRISCGRKLHKKRYHDEKDPIRRRADRLFATIRMGKGKTRMAMDMVREALGATCPYCPAVLSLENMSVDHKTPRQGSRVYNRKTKLKSYTLEELRVIDHRNNLHMVCRDCNAIKNDFSHDEFLIVLAFANNHPTLKVKLWKRLAMIKGFWGMKMGKFK